MHTMFIWMLKCCFHSLSRIQWKTQAAPLTHCRCVRVCVLFVWKIPTYIHFPFSSFDMRKYFGGISACKLIQWRFLYDLFRETGSNCLKKSFCIISMLTSSVFQFIETFQTFIICDSFWQNEKCVTIWQGNKKQKTIFRRNSMRIFRWWLINVFFWNYDELLSEINIRNRICAWGRVWFIEIFGEKV